MGFGTFCKSDANDLAWRSKPEDLAWRKEAAPNTLSVQSWTASSRSSNPAWPSESTTSKSIPLPSTVQKLNWHGKPLRCEMAKSRYKLGTIVRAPLHEEDYSGGCCESYPVETRALIKAKTITESPVGGAIHTKFRKFIVVALFDDHYLAVPMYSYKGDGLVQKEADEYVSVQDHRANAIEPQSRYGLLYTGRLEDHVDHYEPMTAAHFAYPISRKYKLPVVYEGELRQESTRHLLRLYCTFMLGGAGLGSLECQSPIEEISMPDSPSIYWYYSTPVRLPKHVVDFEEQSDW